MSKYYFMKKFTLALFLFTLHINCFALPAGFVYLADIDPTIEQHMMYSTTHNFIGKKITGYLAPHCILTKQTALALHHIQQQLKTQHLGLRVYDCYRPQMAVDEFVRWSKDIQDQKMKKEYYPHINKKDVFKLNYVADLSGHTRGSTVDLTIIYLADNKQGKNAEEVWMGTHIDYLDPASEPFSTAVDKTAQRNRLFLRGIMQQGGFVPLPTEWWHFTLANEPFPQTYFNFAVK